MSVFQVKQDLTLLSALLLAALVFPVALHAAPAQSTQVPPVVGAKAAIVVEYPSGRILYQKAAHQRMAEASTTKIMTAILALEYGKLDNLVTVSPTDLVSGTKMGLRSGERQTLRNLLYGLMLPSGNDAAMTIARYVGSQTAIKGAKAAVSNPVARFIQMMNTRAAALGLKDSHFINPHGLDAPGHYSSAYDLASLTWYAMHFSTFNQIVRQPSYTAPGHALLNLNKMLVRYPGAEGVKTGYTGAAGLCLVTSATRNGHHLISVVLNAPHLYDDSASLLDYGFARVSARPSSSIGERLAIAVKK